MIPSDKEILWESRPSHWIKAHAYLGYAAAAIAFFYGGSVLPSYIASAGLEEALSSVIPYIPGLFYAAGAFCLVGIFWVWLNLRYTHYVLTEDTLYTRSNWLAGDHDTIWIYLIRDVRAELPLHLRIIGLGRIVIESLDHSHPVLTLHGLRNAQEVKGRLNDMARVQGPAHGVRGLDTGAG